MKYQACDMAETQSRENVRFLSCCKMQELRRY